MKFEEKLELGKEEEREKTQEWPTERVYGKLRWSKERKEKD